MTLKLVPATKELTLKYLHEPTGPSFRGIVALLDGEPIGVAGIAYRDGYVEVFSDMQPEMKRYPRAIMKAALCIVEFIKHSGMPAYATANPNEPGADRFLRRIGFEQEGDMYRWHNSL